MNKNDEKIFKSSEKLGYEVVGRIIDTTKILEVKLNILILTYLKPPSDRTEFVKDVLLSNHFLNLGSKIKLFFYINAQEKWLKKKAKEDLRNNFQYILKIRNAIAHDFHSSETTHKNGSIIDFNYKFKCFNNENYSLKTYKGSFDKFNENCSKVISMVINITEAIKNKSI